MALRTLTLMAAAGAAAAQRCQNQKAAGRNMSWYYTAPVTQPGIIQGANATCQPWQAGQSCCTPEYMRVFQQGGEGAVYGGWSYETCQTVNRTISARCRAFLQWEECAYSCDPWLSYYEDPANPGSIKNAPVCSTLCDDWFDACKDDFTCVANWLADSCTDPATQCQTFAQKYGNGANMCRTMWGSSFTVSTDMDNCFGFWWWGSHNPNKAVVLKSGASSAGFSAGILAAAVAVTAVLALPAGAVTGKYARCA